tara:strand:+ start:388 stop:717 length:330 start_codon:yes stop_codon:yes gene_type:complete
MSHLLDPLTPLLHADGTDFTEAERLTFFQNVENSVLNSYKRSRADVYINELSIADQLDMIWHEVDSTGSISKDGEWYNAIKSVKENNPKNDVAYQKALSDVSEMRQKQT